MIEIVMLQRHYSMTYKLILGFITKLRVNLVRTSFKLCPISGLLPKLLHFH